MLHYDCNIYLWWTLRGTTQIPLPWPCCHSSWEPGVFSRWLCCKPLQGQPQLQSSLMQSSHPSLGCPGKEWSVRGWQGLAMLVPLGSPLKAAPAPELREVAWGISTSPSGHSSFFPALPEVRSPWLSLTNILHVQLCLCLLPPGTQSMTFL